ncbi:MAG: ferrochelatase [Bdellovibrionales bacterium]|nr:ferrochelatase [Bdellovibrionales bacterium]
MNRFGCRNSVDRVGVLIAQLGTPNAPTAKALKPYLREFLSDRRVIEKNRFLWWMILNFIVLNVRPKRSARLYSRIWTNEGSPLLSITQKQTAALAEKLGSEVKVVFGMRYGEPSLESGIEELIESGCRRILLFPMYPQYSATTTAATYDAVFPVLLKQRWVPTLRVAEPYYRHPAYLDAVVRTINSGLDELDFKPDRLLFSFHGIPQEYIQKGDPYCCMCMETSTAIRNRLNIDSSLVVHTFQSRFGRDPWLTPYTDVTVEELAKSGVKKIAIACPGFTADCLETLDEIGNEARILFEENGGERLQLIPSLNDQKPWIEAMTVIVKEELGSWIENESIESQLKCSWNC